MSSDSRTFACRIYYVFEIKAGDLFGQIVAIGYFGWYEDNRRSENNRNVVVVEGNNRNVVVVVYSFTIHEAVLKKTS